MVIYISLSVYLSLAHFGVVIVLVVMEIEKDRSSKNESDEEAFAGSTRQCKLLSC